MHFSLAFLPKLCYNNPKEGGVKMENQDYTRYEIKLNRWFNIQAKQNLILLAVLLVLEIAYTVFNNISNHGSSRSFTMSSAYSNR